MRVVSSLADIDFRIGRIFRRGKNLIIESDETSTLDTTVTISPKEALASLGALMISPSAWGFILSLPINIFLASPASGRDTEDWQDRRQRIGLNKPW